MGWSELRFLMSRENTFLGKNHEWPQRQATNDFYRDMCSPFHFVAIHVVTTPVFEECQQ